MNQTIQTSTAPAQTHIPAVRKKVTDNEIKWENAIVLEGYRDSFDWVVSSLYKRLASLTQEKGQTGVAGEFRAKEGQEVKLRCALPFRGRTLFAVCDFLVLKTPNGVSITMGKGKCRVFDLWIIPAAVISFGLLIVAYQTPTGEQFPILKPISKVLTVGFGIVVYLFDFLDRKKAEDPAALGSAQAVIENVFLRFVEELKRNSQ